VPLLVLLYVLYREIFSVLLLGRVSRQSGCDVLANQSALACTDWVGLSGLSQASELLRS
jgi:hypothetical protein